MPLYVAQDALEELTIINTSVNTTGKTVKVFLSTEGGGAGTLIGSGSGAAAGTDIVLNCDFSLVAPGTYVMEVIADHGLTNPITLIPNDVTGWPCEILVYDVENIA